MLFDSFPVPTYLIRRLAPPLQESGDGIDGCNSAALASELLACLAQELVQLLALPQPWNCELLDGLMDFSAPPQREQPTRTWRRRLHQGLQHLVKYLLHDPQARLTGVRQAAHEGSAGIQRFAAEAIQKKSASRKACRSSHLLHTRILGVHNAAADISLYDGLYQAYPGAAMVHMQKQWNRAFHAWCAASAKHYFLMEEEARKRWVSGDRKERSRSTFLTAELKKAVVARRAVSAPRVEAVEWAAFVHQTAQSALPPLGTRLRLLDVGSCTNYFGLEHADYFDVTAVDLAPGDTSVYACDFLQLTVGPQDSAFGASCNARHGGQALHQLPADGFDVAVFALLLSVLPGPQARAEAVAKARLLLRSAPGRGLLIIADTANSVGRHNNNDARSSSWVLAVESAGFRLLRDPQMHLTQRRERAHGGYVQRVACWSFVTAQMPGEGVPSVPLFLLGEECVPRGLSGPRADARQARLSLREARQRRSELRAHFRASRAAPRTEHRGSDVNELLDDQRRSAVPCGRARPLLGFSMP